MSNQCSRCGYANQAQSQFCERCSSPLVIPQQTNQPKKRSGLKILGILSGIGCGGFILLSVILGSLGLLDNVKKPDTNKPEAKQETASIDQQAAQPQESSTPQQTQPTEPQESTSAQQGQSTEPSETISTPPYTDEEYAIYRELIESSGEEPENRVVNRLAKKYKMSPNQINAAAEKVMTHLHSGGSDKNREKENQVRAAIEPLARVKAIVVSSEFASIAYIDQSSARNDADVKAKVLAGMPKILEAAFSVPEIRRVRLIAYFPTIEGGELKVAGFEADRPEFHPSKRPQEYKEFWVK